MSYLKDISFPLKRYAFDQILSALGTSCIVAVIGPRQSGKTTLCQLIAKQLDMEFHSMDDQKLKTDTEADISAFIESKDPMVIDEIQKVSGLISAIKLLADKNPERRGRFLITGSLDLVSGTLGADAVGGPVTFIRLLSLSQGEIHGIDPSNNLLDFSLKIGKFNTFCDVGKTPFLQERLALGGYPEAVSRHKKGQDSRGWIKNHYKSILYEDVPESKNIDRFVDFQEIMSFAVETSGKLINYSHWATILGVSSSTVKYWLKILERIFLFQRVLSWRKNLISQRNAAPKIHFLDSGLWLAAIGETAEEIFAARDYRLGALLESFIYSEVLKLAYASWEDIEVFHYRDSDKVEVDLVVVGHGRVMAIEVKASARVYGSDFHGLQRIKEISGDKFSCGILFHDGEKIEQPIPGFYAMPFHVLWSAPEEIFKSSA